MADWEPTSGNSPPSSSGGSPEEEEEALLRKGGGVHTGDDRHDTDTAEGASRAPSASHCCCLKSSFWLGGIL